MKNNDKQREARRANKQEGQELDYMVREQYTLKNEVMAPPQKEPQSHAF